MLVEFMLVALRGGLLKTSTCCVLLAKFTPDDRWRVCPATTGPQCYLLTTGMRMSITRVAGDGRLATRDAKQAWICS